MVFSDEYKANKKLSKSRYCRGIQCPKILWLDEHKSEVRDDSVLNQAVMDTGNKVGDIAMGYYGEFAEVSYHEDKSIMLAHTKELLDKKAKTICEASFANAGNFCSVDILRVFDDGSQATACSQAGACAQTSACVEIVEVKSSTELKPIYNDDAAFQYFVLSSIGIKVKKVSLMYVNNKYERRGELDLHGLFKVHNCTKKVLSMQEEVASNISRFRDTIAGEEPERDIGEHCFDPYECAYCAYCWRHIPQNSVFDISGHSLRMDKKLNLYRRGIVSFEQLLESGEKLNDNTLLQLTTTVYNRPPTIYMEGIRSFLNTLSWPLYFLDFESFMEAIPGFDGQRPYMQIPFQYSLHIQKAPGAETEHREFLAQEGRDPRRDLAESLCTDIPKNVCVLVYSMGYEKGRIKELAALFDDLSEHLLNIRDNIKDLMQPFQTRSYYSRELGKSYSIKKVLPALCPDDPELDYNALDLIHNGGEAMTAFAQLPGKNPQERQRIRAALLAYCRLDTLAMVKILDKLREFINGFSLCL